MVTWLNAAGKALVPEVREMIAHELLAGTHIDSMTQDISTIGPALLLQPTDFSLNWSKSTVVPLGVGMS